MTKRSLWDDTQRAAVEASLEFLEPITAATRRLFGTAARRRQLAAPSDFLGEIVGPVEQAPRAPAQARPRERSGTIG